MYVKIAAAIPIFAIRGPAAGAAFASLSFVAPSPIARIGTIYGIRYGTV